MGIDPRTPYDFKKGDWAGFNYRHEGILYKFPSIIESIYPDNGLSNVIKVTHAPAGCPLELQVEQIEWMSAIDAVVK